MKLNELPDKYFQIIFIQNPVNICEIDRQSNFNAWNRALKARALGQPGGMEWGERHEGGFEKGGHMYIHG